MVLLQACVLAAALAGNQEFELLDFAADWCAPCRGMEPTLQRLRDAGYPVRHVNVDQNPDWARHFAVQSLPCFVLIKNGREVQRVVGATSYDAVVELFQQAGHHVPSAGAVGVRGQSPDRATPALVPGTGSNASPIPRSAPHDRAGEGTGSRLPGPQPNPLVAILSSTADQVAPQAQQLALQATVRLRVIDAQGQSKGTGTIIDVVGDEALVLTCGHIFRESKGQGEIRVELFAPGSRGPVAGHLLAYECDQRDYGLLSIRPDTRVTPVPVAPATSHPQPGEQVFSIGCDQGGHPTVRASSISAINRYTGPPNIEIHGHPVEGRSGGGLFTSQGILVGICNAADLQEDRGIYAGLPTIHLALDRIGQRRIYLPQAPGDEPLLAGHSQPPPMVPMALAAAGPLANSPPPSPVSRHASSPMEPGEVICIVRQPDGTNRLLVIKNPSADLLQRVAAESWQPPLAGRSTNASADSREAGQRDLARLPDTPSFPGPVVRAQGY